MTGLPKEEYLNLLDKIVRLWPKKGEEVSPALQKLIAHDFDKQDFLSEVRGIRIILQVDEPDTGGVNVDFQDETGYEHRAHFTAGETGSLQWLKFQCPGCFGTGINNEEVCTLCDGLGWGAGR